MQKLELIDAEKRARRSDVQRCGVDSLLVNDIPFGVRAIQRGIEVDGIWISISNTPELSQVASSATLVGDQQESLNSEKKTRTGQRSREVSESIGSSTDETTRREPPALWLHTSVPTNHRSMSQPGPGSRDLRTADHAALRLYPNSYMPRRDAKRHGMVERRHRVPRSAPQSRTVEEDCNANMNPIESRLEQASNDAAMKRDGHTPHRSLDTDPVETILGRHEVFRVNESEGDDIGRNRAPRPRRHRLSRKPPRAQLR
jgi:hypothetical protein